MLTCTAKMQIIGSNRKMDIKLQGINMCLGERERKGPILINYNG